MLRLGHLREELEGGRESISTMRWRASKYSYLHTKKNDVWKKWGDHGGGKTDIPPSGRRRKKAGGPQVEAAIKNRGSRDTPDCFPYVEPTTKKTPTIQRYRPLNGRKKNENVSIQELHLGRSSGSDWQEKEVGESKPAIRMHNPGEGGSSALGKEKINPILFLLSKKSRGGRDRLKPVKRRSLPE